MVLATMLDTESPRWQQTPDAQPGAAAERSEGHAREPPARAAETQGETPTVKQERYDELAG